MLLWNSNTCISCCRQRLMSNCGVLTGTATGGYLWWDIFCQTWRAVQLTSIWTVIFLLVCCPVRILLVIRTWMQFLKVFQRHGWSSCKPVLFTVLKLFHWVRFNLPSFLLFREVQSEREKSMKTSSAKYLYWVSGLTGNNRRHADSQTCEWANTLEICFQKIKMYFSQTKKLKMVETLEAQALQAGSWGNGTEVPGARWQGGWNEPVPSSVPCQKSGQVSAVCTDGVGSARGGIDFCICPAVFAFTLQQITCVTEVVVHWHLK